jgi:uncharacterized protein
MFEDLLQVQDHDTDADRLRHRRASLPERSELAEVIATAASIEKTAASVSEELATVTVRQRRLEDELASTENKVVELDRKLYSGSVVIPKELQALQADIDGLRRHASHLEDELLELMEAREPHDAESERMAEQRAMLDTRGKELREAIAAAEAEIDRELTAVLDARATAAASMSSDLLSLYEQLRGKLGGIGAARLEPGGRCGGCHLTLPSTEVARIKREPPEAVITCDQCGRILVRVAPAEA